MKTLKTLNTLSSICRRISYVLLIVTIVVLVFLLGFFMIYLLDAETVSNETVRLTGRRNGTIELETLDIIIYFIVLMLFAAKEVCLSNLSYKYFVLEKNAGTPFNKEAAEGLGKLGVYKIVISVFHNVLTVVLLQFTSDGVFDASLVMNYNPLPSVSLGVMLIFASYISRYGSEIEA